MRAAHAAERLGEREAALAFARLAVVGDPGLADAHRALGVAAYRAGDRATARTALREALRLDPRNDAARRELLTTLRGGTPLHRATFALQRRMRGAGARAACFFAVVLCAFAFMAAEEFGATRLATVVGILPLTLLLPLWIVPLHDLLVWRDPLGRLLLHPAERAAAAFTTAVLALAAGLAVAWQRTGADRWGWLALGFAAYATLGGLVRGVRSRVAARRVAIYCALVAGDLAAIWLVSAGEPFDASLLILAFPTLWMSAFTARRWLLALPAAKRR